MAETSKNDYYGYLSIPICSSIEEVKIAFKYLKNKYSDSESPLKNIKILKQIHEAFEFLSSVKNKKKLDKSLQVKKREADKIFHSGMEALRDGKYKSSIKYLKRSLKLEPYSSAAHEALGLALQYSGEIKKAIAGFLLASQLPLATPIVFKYLADAYKMQGQISKASGFYTLALEKLTGELNRPENEEKRRYYLTIIADIYWQQGIFEEVEKIYLKLLKEEGNAEIYRDLAILYYEMNYLDEGINACKSAISLGMKDASIFLYKGLLLFKKRFLTRALTSMKKSYKLDPAQKSLRALIKKIEKISENIGQTVEELIDNSKDLKAEHIGQINWYNPETGMGYIDMSKGEKAFLHYCGLSISQEEEKILEKGTKVKFAVVNDEQIGAVAVNVTFYTVESKAETGLENLLKGAIHWYDANRGIGIIFAQTGEEVFFSRSNLNPLFVPEKGQKVEFSAKSDPGISDRAVLKAVSVRLLAAS
ncbi:cold shock domain-containing protein [Candidatus Riflebacteria bacterium]